MKIFYISYLPETMSGGPKYSVPAQIANQAKNDDVFWVNMSRVDVDYCGVPVKTITEVKDVLREIESAKPDIVVFEDLYYLEFPLIAKNLTKRKVPYIIIPRGCMTACAQRKKRFKKFVGNTLFFNRFIDGALAIEYLAENERKNAFGRWRGHYSIVIPNGVNPPTGCEMPLKKRKEDSMEGVFIGRLDAYAKGIDALLDACATLKDVLSEKNVKISLYGPIDERNERIILDKINSSGLEQIVFVNGEIHGRQKDKALKDADFFILTSRFEGMPMGLLEAMAYGLPSVITYETNMGEEIVKKNAGFCSKCTSSGIVSSLNSVIQLGEEDYNAISNNAVRLSKEYDWGEIAKRTHAIYEGLLKTKNCMGDFSETEHTEGSTHTTERWTV